MFLRRLQTLKYDLMRIETCATFILMTKKDFLEFKMIVFWKLSFRVQAFMSKLESGTIYISEFQKLVLWLKVPLQISISILYQIYLINHNKASIKTLFSQLNYTFQSILGIKNSFFLVNKIILFFGILCSRIKKIPISSCRGKNYEFRNAFTCQIETS